jgi:pyruvate formate lyase activating enzyme
MQDAMWYEKSADKGVICHLCPHKCHISEGQSGICRVRINQAGRLLTKNYGLCTRLTTDPIEKKPLYHFYPGKDILSLGTLGCNFKCAFCQNWHLAHEEPSLAFMEPVQIVEAANSFKEQGSVGIAYTYSEPTVWYEFIYETSKLAKEAGLKNVMVTNGYISEQPLQELIPYLDALNIDVKAFNEDFYRKYIKGDYKQVLKTAEIAVQANCHVEITSLLVPGLNDSQDELKALVEWCASKLGKDVPLHFSRYFPSYMLDLPPTPLSTLEKAYEIGVSKLNYVYIGNAPELRKSNTYCPKCNNMIIARSGYGTKVTGVINDKCVYCGEELAIITC